MSIHSRKSQKAFTVVELTVVIVALGILVSIVVIGFGAWRKQTAVSQLKSDLNAVSHAMENSRNYAQGYPTSIPATVAASSGVTLSYISGDDKKYCVQATSTSASGVTYYLSSSDSTTPKEGTCPLDPLSAPTIASITVTGTQAALSWGSVANANSYDIQYRRNSGSWTSITGNTSTTRTITGLTVSSTYDFQVRSNGTNRPTGSWSGSTTRVVVPTPTITSATDNGCGNSGGVYSWLNVGATWTATSKTYTSYYRFDTGGTYGYVPQTIANTTGSGSLNTVTSSSQWMANGSGSGTIYLYGMGPNGEKSSAATWTSGVHPPYDC